MRDIHMHARPILCPLVIRCFYTDKYTPTLVDVCVQWNMFGSFFHLFCTSNRSSFYRVSICKNILSRFYGFILYTCFALRVYLFCSMFSPLWSSFLVISLAYALLLFLLLFVLTVYLVFLVFLCFICFLSFIHRVFTVSLSVLLTSKILIYYGALACTLFLSLYFCINPQFSSLFYNFSFVFFHYYISSLYIDYFFSVYIVVFI